MKVSIYAFVDCEIQQEFFGQEKILGEGSMDALGIKKTSIVNISSGLMWNVRIK